MPGSNEHWVYKALAWNKCSQHLIKKMLYIINALMLCILTMCELLLTENASSKSELLYLRQNLTKVFTKQSHSQSRQQHPLFNSYGHNLVNQCFYLNWWNSIVLSGLLVGRGKKSQISRDFQGPIRGKNGRFRGNFAGIFEACFAEKWLVKNGRFRGSFPSKFRWKAIGFCTDIEERFQWN